MTRDATLTVLARAPIPGRAKTRMVPPLRPEQAAELHAACVHDVLDRAWCGLRRRLLIDGPAAFVGPGHRVGWELGTQIDGDLGARIEQALDGRGIRVVLGTDSPDLPDVIVEGAVDALRAGVADAVFGPAADGGYTMLAVSCDVRGAFADIAWSQPTTLQACAEALTSRGVRVALGPMWRDLDDIDDVRAFVARGDGALATGLAWRTGVAPWAGLALDSSPRMVPGPAPRTMALARALVAHLDGVAP